MEVYLRNKQSREIRVVESDSEQFEDLRQQVAPDGHSPLWEQTSEPDAKAEMEAQDNMAPNENPPEWANLTPAEVEAGLTPEDKAEELREQFGWDPTGDYADHVDDVTSDPPGGTNFKDLSKDELERLVEQEGLEVEGTGANGNVLVSDLVEALEENERDKAAQDGEL